MCRAAAICSTVNFTESRFGNSISTVDGSVATGRSLNRGRRSTGTGQPVCVSAYLSVYLSVCLFVYKAANERAHQKLATIYSRLEALRNGEEKSRPMKTVFSANPAVTAEFFSPFSTIVPSDILANALVLFIYLFIYFGLPFSCYSFFLVIVVVVVAETKVSANIATKKKKKIIIRRRE